MAIKTTSWRDLLPGTIAMAAILLAVFAVFKYARLGGIHGDKATIWAITGGARGVIAGTTEVWLDGQKIGQVREVDFRDTAIDTSQRVAIKLEVLEAALTRVRRDSRGQIRAGGSLIGAPVIYLSAGTVASPALKDGDSLLLRPQGDAESMSAQVAMAGREFPAIIANVKGVLTQLGETRGTAGAVMSDERMREQLGTFTDRASGLMRRATTGRGSLGLVMHGELGARAGRAMSAADSIRALVSSGETSLGRFRRDSTLLRQVADVRAELSIVQALLAEPRGTAGRVLADSAAQMELGRMTREMGLLFEDIKRNPMRYLAF